MENYLEHTPDSKQRLFKRFFKLSIVVPMHNEADAIDSFFSTVIPVVEQETSNYEIICVNDGSSDKTLELLKRQNRSNPHIKIIDLSRNFGKEAALTAGLDHATGDAVIPLDADLQDPPELIPQLLEKWYEGYKVVLGVREDRRSDTFIKRVSARLFYRFAGCMSEVSLPANAGDFRLMDHQVVAALQQMPERIRFMKGIFAWLGFDQTQVCYVRPPRSKGVTKWRFWKLWNFALDGIFSFSTFPLRVWTYFGLLIATMAVCYMLFIVTSVLMRGIDVPGYASTLVILLFFSGLNMVGLGILGEYVGRIFVEVKQRPLYIVNQTFGFDAPRADVSGVIRRRQEQQDRFLSETFNF